MKTNQLKWGSALSYMQMALHIIIGFVYTPVMLRLLGQSEYGLYQTVSSTISMLSVLNLGFNSSYVRYYSRYKKEKDNKSIYKLNGLFLLIFLIIGIIALGCGLFLSSHLEMVFDKGLTREEYGTARILMILLAINLAISFPMSVFTSIISANERYVYLKLLGMIKTVLSPLVTLPLLLMGYRSIAMVVVTVVLALFTDVLYLYYVIFVLKNKFLFRHFEEGIFVSLFTYTIFIAINMIVDQINLNVDKILLGRFKGTAAVSVYSVGFLLYTFYMMFSTSVSSVFTPRVHQIVNATRHDEEIQRRELTQLFTKVGRIQFLILGLVASGIVFFGKVFIMDYWAGRGYGDSYYVALLLVVPGSIALIQNLGIEIQRAENQHQFRSVVYMIMALINLGLSIVLCQWYGAIGSAVGTAVSLIVANGLIMNIYYHKKCNIDIIYFWKNILWLSKGMILPVITGIVILKGVKVSSFIELFIAVLIYSAVYCVSMWSVGMNCYEKQLIVKPLEKVLRRKMS